jgi:cell division septal protein FtsQ
MFAYRRKKRLPISISSKKLRRLPRKMKNKWQTLLFGGFFILFFTGLCWLFIFSPYFKIKETVASGSDQVISESIKEFADNFLQKRILQIFPGDSFFMFSAGKLAEDILKNFPSVNEVQIKQFFPKKIEVVFKNREAAAILCRYFPLTENATTTDEYILPVSDRCFFADGEGVVYKDAPEISGNFLLTLYFPNQEMLNFGDRALASSTIKFAGELKKELRDKNVEINNFLVKDASGQEIHAISPEGWVAYFSGTRSAISQAKVLEVLLIDEIKEKRKSLKYIDLRLPNRAYYK